MDKGFEQQRGRLGGNIRERRLALGLSQEALAFEAEIDRTYVSQLERGVINPSLLILWRVAKALKANIKELL